MIIKLILIIFFQFLCFLSFSQGIVNTESSLRNVNDGFNFSNTLEGDIQTGNVDIIEVNSSIIFSYKFNKTLIRLINGYEYLEEDKIVESNDLSSHLRINHFSSKKEFNSFYVFFQIQSAKSIFQKSRRLIGSGYRFRVIKKLNNYFDISPGYFIENEIYDFKNQDIKVKNNRLSLNNFFHLELNDKISIDSVTYFQLNSEDRSDFRLYIEPKLLYNLNKINFYLRYLYKYHSSPYIDIFKLDRDLLLGIEINLN